MRLRLLARRLWLLVRMRMRRLRLLARQREWW